MLEIDIAQFEGYGEGEFNDFLVAHNTHDFTLLLRKESVLFNTSNDELAHEYGSAAFVGEKINELSTEFAYFEAPLTETGEFVFEFKTDKIRELASVLFYISSGYGNSELMDPIDFQCEVFDFIENAKVDEVACPNLITTCIEYMPNDSDSD